MAMIGILSPRANGILTKSASIAQVQAKPFNVGRCSVAANEYIRPPIPIPRRATARMRPKVNAVPPRIGLSIRYQTSSIKRKTKPVTAEATKTRYEELAGSRTGLGLGGIGRP